MRVRKFPFETGQLRDGEARENEVRARDYRLFFSIILRYNFTFFAIVL